MGREIKIRYVLKSQDDEIYVTMDYKLKELEDCCEVEDMIISKDGECVCLLNESDAYCDCGGFFTNSFSCEKEFKIIDRLEYTGLKDSKGKEIYEGDILKKVFDDSDKFSVVEYYDCSFVAYNKELNKRRPINTKNMGLGWIKVNSIGYDFEVIGNIYENPELLEGD